MKKNELTHITHTMPAIFKHDCKVLINGSMLSPKSREYSLYYGHPHNRFWKVFCGLWGDDVPETPGEKHDYALSRNIALWNVIAECDIKGAADSTIQNVVANDMNQVLDNTDVVAIFNLGNKAGELFKKYCEPKLNRDVHVQTLPSTSPANAAWKLEDLIEEYEVIRTYVEG